MNKHTNQDGLIIWEFDFALSTFFEVETDSIEHLPPKSLRPMEVAPGVSLISLIALNFPEGALGKLPGFQELILSLIVTPDLSRGVPKSAMYILSLGSTNQEHLDHCVSYYKLPVYGTFTTAELSPEKHTVRYEDSNGPILTMENVHPNPKFDDGELYFQAFVEDTGDIYVADVVMKGSLFEHQQAGQAGQMWNHPFYRGIDVNNDEPMVYMQMLNEPGTLGHQFYPRPEKLT